MRELTTTAQVMDELGGNAAVAALTGRKYNAAANWRAFDAFPANTFLIMTTALREKGCTAPASLWSMATATEPDAEERAIS
jgi:hypothetical protein